MRDEAKPRFVGTIRFGDGLVILGIIASSLIYAGGFRATLEAQERRLANLEAGQAMYAQLATRVSVSEQALAALQEAIDRLLQGQQQTNERLTTIQVNIGQMQTRLPSP